MKFTVRVKLHKVSDHRVTQILQECVASNVAKPRGYLVMRSVVLSRKSLFGEQNFGGKQRNIRNRRSKSCRRQCACQLSRFKGGLRWRGKFILASKPDFSKILIPALAFITYLL